MIWVLYSEILIEISVNVKDKDLQEREEEGYNKLKWLADWSKLAESEKLVKQTKLGYFCLSPKNTSIVILKYLTTLLAQEYRTPKIKTLDGNMIQSRQLQKLSIMT